MDAKPEAHAEGNVNDAAEHKTLDRAIHRTPIVYDHDVQYNGDDRPNNSVDDFKSFHIHVVFIVFALSVSSRCLSSNQACAFIPIKPMPFLVSSVFIVFVGRSGDSPDLEWLVF